MQEYRKYISSLAEKRVNEDFMNSDEEHALEVLVKIFRMSSTTLRIFAHNLCNDVANNSEYVQAISDFIEKGGSVKILLNDFSEEEALSSNLMKRLAFYQLQGKDIIIRTSHDKPFMSNDSEKKEVHFTIGDEVAYRIETDVVERTAICNFNNEEYAKQLIIFYDSLISKAEVGIVDLVKLFKLTKDAD